MAERLVERLEDCTRRFPRALILGGAGAQVLLSLGRGRAGVERATLVDTSRGMLRRARERLQGSGGAGPQAEFVLAPAGPELLPVDPGSYDGEPARCVAGAAWLRLLLAPRLLRPLSSGPPRAAQWWSAA